jgi:hypothetical protein
MAWTTIPNSDIDQDSPITQTLMTALRDNPIAIANGDAGAPRIAGIAAMSHEGAAGAVGTYVWARRTASGNQNFGDATGGSNLQPTGAIWGTSGFSASTNNMPSNAALSGTWRCMGRMTETQTSAPDGSGNVSTIRGATLYLRIS